MSCRMPPLFCEHPLRGLPAKTFAHQDEGPDDMPAHLKSSLLGCSLNISISNGQFRLGIWQSICLCEHRDSGGSRRVAVTLQGE